MGMTMSTYAVFNSLIRGRSDKDFDFVRKAINPFNLYAIILHDPEKHREFHQFLTEKFAELHVITGDKLLFFALVDPPESWLLDVAGRECYQKLKNVETRVMLSDNTIKTHDPGITAFSLATNLNIPIVDLPCIVVTNYFKSDHFLWFKTCSEHIGEQLQTLALAASYKKELRFDPKRGEALLRIIQRDKLNLCKGSGNQILQDDLAEVIFDSLSFSVVNSDADFSNKQRAIQKVKKILHKSSQELKKEKQSFEESDSDKIDKICIALLSKLAQLSSLPSSTLLNSIPIDSNLLEIETQYILRSALMVDNLFFNEQNGLIHRNEGFDFSLNVVGFAKVFENELNLSIVHWIRKKLGISLPAYFNKHQPTITAKILPDFQDPKAIDFNKKSSGNWHPPGIGQSILACNKIKKRSGLPKKWDQANWNILYENWRVIAKERNPAAHTGFVCSISAQAVKNAIEKLAENQIFDKMYHMKCKYRGD